MLLDAGSLYAVVASGRKGSIVCFLYLLLFDQDREEAVRLLSERGPFLGDGRTTLPDTRLAKSRADKRLVELEIARKRFWIFWRFEQALPKNCI